MDRIKIIPCVLFCIIIINAQEYPEFSPNWIKLVLNYNLDYLNIEEPYFADFDLDGDRDLLAFYKYDLRYFQNIGSENEPFFDLVDNVNSLNWRYGLYVIDYDNDLDLDILYFDKDNNYVVSFCEIQNAQPTWQNPAKILLPADTINAKGWHNRIFPVNLISTDPLPQLLVSDCPSILFQQDNGAFNRIILEENCYNSSYPYEGSYYIQTFKMHPDSSVLLLKQYMAQPYGDPVIFTDIYLSSGSDFNFMNQITHQGRLRIYPQQPSLKNNRYLTRNVYCFSCGMGTIYDSLIIDFDNQRHWLKQPIFRFENVGFNDLAGFDYKNDNNMNLILNGYSTYGAVDIGWDISDYYCLPNLDLKNFQKIYNPDNSFPLFQSGDGMLYFDLADLNSDGNTDILKRKYSYNFPESNEISICLNQGTNSRPIWDECEIFKKIKRDHSEINPQLVDYDGDEDLDLIVEDIINYEVSLYKIYSNIGNKYQYEFMSEADTLGLVSVKYGCFSDLDNDGDLDCIGTFQNQVVYYQNDSDHSSNSFTKVDHVFDSLSAIENIAALYLKDLDSDKDKDLIVMTTKGELYISENTSPLQVSTADPSHPFTFDLHQNYPNPFNPSTTISYQLPKSDHVELSIYNLLGQKIAILVSEQQQAGKHQVSWDATGFPSGIYYYVLKAGEFRQVKKMVLLR